MFCRPSQNQARQGPIIRRHQAPETHRQGNETHGPGRSDVRPRGWLKSSKHGNLSPSLVHGRQNQYIHIQRSHLDVRNHRNKETRGQTEKEKTSDRICIVTLGLGILLP